MKRRFEQSMCCTLERKVVVERENPIAAAASSVLRDVERRVSGVKFDFIGGL